MAARYAHWRRPDTLIAKPRDEGKYAPANLLKVIGKISRISDDGKVQWRGLMSYFTYKRAIFDSIAIRKPGSGFLNENDRDILVDRALAAVVKKEGAGKPIRPAALREQIDILAAEFFRGPSNDYVILTSWAVENFPEFDEQVFGARIKKGDRGEYELPHSLLEEYEFLKRHLSNTKYEGFQVEVAAVSEAQAFETGTRAINAFRGLLTLVLTYGVRKWLPGKFGGRQYLGKIARGPIQTVHQVSRPRASGQWFSEEHSDDYELFCPTGGWEPVLAEAKKLAELVAALPYKESLLTLLERYSVAFDQSQLDVAFLMLWSILEVITSTQGGNYDKTIKRALWFAKDRDAAKHILQQARMRRNMFVHGAQSLSDREEYIQVVKTAVDIHLASLINNQFGVTNVKEYGDYLSLPINRERVEALRDRLTRVLKLRWKDE